MTSSGIEHATFRLVAQGPNQLIHQPYACVLDLDLTSSRYNHKRQRDRHKHTHTHTHTHATELHFSTYIMETRMTLKDPTPNHIIPLHLRISETKLS